MSEPLTPQDADEGAFPNDPPPSMQSSQVRHETRSARVPPDIAPGVFSTGVVVLSGRHEFILDFVVRLVRPHRLAARVVLPPGVVPQVIDALRQSVERYERRFGVPIPREYRTPTPAPAAAPPTVPGDEHATLEQIAAPGPAPLPVISQQAVTDAYDEMKAQDDALAGAYANGMVITSSQFEFCLDFFTGFFPRSVVSARVYMSAGHIPRMLEALDHAWKRAQPSE